MADNGNRERKKRGTLSSLEMYWAENDPHKRLDFVSTILESLPFPFYVIEADTYQILLSNRTDLPVEKRHTCYELTHHREHPCDGQEHPCGLEICKETGRSVQLEHIHYDHQNRPRNVMVSNHPIFDDDGRVVQVIEYSMDITVQKKIEKRLRSSREEALRANQTKSQFLSSMSHELRTPLNAILGFTQLMGMDQNLEEKYQDYVKKIMGAGRHLLELIDDILDLSKVDTGEIQLSVENLEPESILRECFRMVKSKAAKAEISLTTSVEEGCTVQADRLRLKQVMMNLLSNAVKYNHRGGEVEVKVYGQENKVVFEVIDTGWGIPAEKLPELFEAFNRLGAQATEVQGTGVGLSLSKKLTELMDGKIGVSSEYGKGSKFWIELPRAASSSANEEAEVDTGSTGDLSKQDQGKGEKKVLYFEDDHLNVRLMEQTLGRQRGLKMFSANTAAKGLEIARQERPDLVLMDLNMPDMSGYEILQHVRESEWGREIPVYAVTAHVLEEDIKKGKTAGFTEYLTKPLDVPGLIEMVKKQLSLD
ncbi:MAG TPA: response regulator [Sediminispirochaeta sp.]|nr:response regulator [Sediminispirochaeta sp.]